MPKTGFITLWFNAEDFQQEEGRPLDDAMLNDFGKDINDQAVHFLGYEGWVTGWFNFPDKPKTIDDLVTEAKALDRSQNVHLVMAHDKVSGVVTDRVSGVEFDVGYKEEMGESLYYANDDEGRYTFGKTLAEALQKGFDAQQSG